MIKRHRNSQKRILFENAIYFVTIKTKNNYPYFKNIKLCELFVEELRLCKVIKGFELFGFCILYDHIHLLIKPSKEFNISRVIFSIKKQFSHDANRLLNYNLPFHYYHSLEDNKDGGKIMNLEGEKINDLEGAKTFSHLPIIDNFHKTNIENNLHHGSRKFKWQESFHDHYIRNFNDFNNHLTYTNSNYLKHNLPTNWKYWSENYIDLIDFY